MLIISDQHNSWLPKKLILTTCFNFLYNIQIALFVTIGLVGPEPTLGARCHHRIGSCTLQGHDPLYLGQGVDSSSGFEDVTWISYSMRVRTAMLL